MRSVANIRGWKFQLFFLQSIRELFAAGRMDNRSDSSAWGSVRHTNLRDLVAQIREKSRIFVVDDELIIASTLATILRMNGFDALSFTHAKDALRAGREKAPDLLISDVIMPEMTGVELAILMQKLCPACKILLFSGQAATANLLQSAREKGHNFELLAKPIHPAEFLQKIKEVSGHAEPKSMPGALEVSS